jgi:hypothetical protein
MHPYPLAVLLVVALCQAGSSKAANPVRESYLVLDSRLVASTDNARLSVGTVTKHPSNPLFAEDKPWEVRFDNLYANILYDSDERIFKCWYSPFIRDVTNKPAMENWDDVSYGRELGKLKGNAARRMGICFATSKDGIQWGKSDLNLVEFDGSKANNLIYLDPHGAGIFKDLAEPDASRRYKMITGAQPHGALSSAFSADGLHWSPLQQIARVRGDTHNNAFWNPIQKNYVAISREFSNGNRTVVRMQSDDFINWSEPNEILRGTKDAQTYAMPVLYRHGVFLGLIAVFDTDSDRVTTELAWSPDTVTWHRIDKGNPLIPLAEQGGRYDWGCAFAAASPVIMPDGEIRIYYGASNGKHTSWRDGFLALATLRPNGWAGYEPVDRSKVASVYTSPLVCPDGALRVTADAKGGEIRVKMIGSDGKVLAVSTPIAGDVTRVPISWIGDPDLTRLKGETIKLQFTIQGGRLYSFSFD